MLYEKPTLIDFANDETTQGQAINCLQTGSSATGSCYNNGNSAQGNACIVTGNNAAAECGVGVSAAYCNSGTGL